MRDLEFFFPHHESLPTERTLALVKPDGIARGRIDGRTLEEFVESQVADAGIIIVAKKCLPLTKEQAGVLCRNFKDKKDFNGAVGVLMTEPGVVAMLLEGPGVVGRWKLFCGPTNSGLARERAPTTLRACWGTDSTSNAVHASDSIADAEDEIRAIFPPGTLKVQRTLCMVKPDALADLLSIQMAIKSAGFTILKQKQIVLTIDRAKEFYRDSLELPSFLELVQDTCAGPVCVMVLCRLEAVTVWKQLMGPETRRDAQKQMPNSIRARYGGTGFRNAVHGSDRPKNAIREVRFFFPELGADPMPDENEVRDFLFRKSAQPSMDLKNVEATSDFSADPTLQHLLSKGLMAMCKVQPKGLSAVKWLSRWLAENHPDAIRAAEEAKFAPPSRSRRFIEYGVNDEGMTFSVEAPPAAQKGESPQAEEARKKAAEALEAALDMEDLTPDLEIPPYVIFVIGGPGAGKRTQCVRLTQGFNFVYLNLGSLLQDEVAAETELGTEIYQHMQNGTSVPDSVTLQLLKQAMAKRQDTNRFLIDGFPRSLEQAKRFEQSVGCVAFLLYLEASPDILKARVGGRATKAPGKVDDTPATIDKRLKIFEDQTLNMVRYYEPIGKVRKVDAAKSIDEVFEDAKRSFCCRFTYVLGPPGTPVKKVAENLAQQYSYVAIDFMDLLERHAQTNPKEAAQLKTAFAKGKPVQASTACPLVLEEIEHHKRLGVHNFVISGFPQSLKQAEFLEYRIPCVPKSVLLDFGIKDSEDMAAILGSGSRIFDVGSTVGAFYVESGEMQEMLPKLSGLVRVPCSLAQLVSIGHGDASPAGFEKQLVDMTWAALREKVMPSVSLVLGPPCSGTSTLAKMLADLTPNTQAVDCAQLLSKEMDRKTDMGIEMLSMQENNGKVPLSMTLFLLKGIINFTCSDSIILENCPMKADQIAQLEEEFRIDRVYYISGSDKALAAWKEEYSKKSSAQSQEHDNFGSLTFVEHMENLEPLVRYFSRRGRLDRFEVSKTPEPPKLKHEIEQCTQPQFAIVQGLSFISTPERAKELASAYGSSRALSTEFIVDWAKTSLQRTVDPAQPDQFISALQKYAAGNSGSLLVLDRYPKTAEDAAQFLTQFGEPKVIVNLDEDENLQTEWDDFYAEDDSFDTETIPDLIAGQRTVLNDTMKLFAEQCPSRLMPVEAGTPSEEVIDGVRRRLLPRVYVILAPSGLKDFSGKLVEAICTSKRGAKRVKFTAVDSEKLFVRGCHSAKIEDELLKASLTAKAPDSLTAKLWSQLYSEAFSNSPNPMGNFLIFNFPSPSATQSGPGPAIRDQFHVLESISQFMGILCVKLGESAFAEFCSEEAEALDKYTAFSEEVTEQIAMQFPGNKICDVEIEEAKNTQDAVKKVVSSFVAFQEKLEA